MTSETPSAVRLPFLASKQRSDFYISPRKKKSIHKASLRVFGGENLAFCGELVRYGGREHPLIKIGMMGSIKLDCHHEGGNWQSASLAGH